VVKGKVRWDQGVVGEVLTIAAPLFPEPGKAGVVNTLKEIEMIRIDFPAKLAKFLDLNGDIHPGKIGMKDKASYKISAMFEFFSWLNLVGRHFFFLLNSIKHMHLYRKNRVGINKILYRRSLKCLQEQLEY